MVGRDDSMQHALLVADKEMLKIDGGAGDDRRSTIGRAAIGVDQNGPMVREVFREADTHGPHDMADRVCVVVARDPDEYIR